MRYTDIPTKWRKQVEVVPGKMSAAHVIESVCRSLRYEARLAYLDGRSAQSVKFNDIANTIEREAAKPGVYHTLVQRDDTSSRWAIEFGAYVRDDVKGEMECRRADGIKRGNLKIITTGESQVEIEAAVAVLNAPLLPCNDV